MDAGGSQSWGLFNVYDGDGNIVSCDGVEEQQDFITHARVDVPALLAEVRWLRELVKEKKNG